MRRALLVAAAACALAVALPARAGDGLFVGFDDTWFLEQPAAAIAAASDLGAKGFRVPLYWHPGQTTLSAADEAVFDRVVPAAFAMRVVVVVTGLSPRQAPLTPAARNSYCDYVRSFLLRYPSVADIVIWNEPNKSADWRPQFIGRRSVAPAAYEALLARCWDVLHAARPDVDVLAPAASPSGNDDPRAVSNVSHSPRSFILGLGRAYRASGRTRPIFDNVAHHMYGSTPGERPWRQHVDGRTIAEGDWSALMGTLRTAFGSTRQPIPGRCVAGRCASIWYLEAGYQTSVVPAKRRLYRSHENVPVIPDSAGGETTESPSPDSRAPDQATQIVDGIRLAYCQPYVAAFFNYLLRDDRDLRAWQSGALWRDGTPKRSYGAFRRAIAEANARKVDCAALKGGPLPYG